MIVLARAKVRFLMAGRTLDIEVKSPGRYTRGRTYALGADQRTTICRVEIIDTTDTSLKVRLARTDQPRLLRPSRTAARLGDYTDDTHQAMVDEPEAVDPHELDRINRRYRERVTALRGTILAEVDDLAVDASGVDARRLRNLRRITSSL
jgi:hypothetical protein